MKPMAIVGLVVLVFGLLALFSGGIPYTSRETVLRIGDLRATADRERTLTLPRMLAVAAVGGGVALLVVGMRKRA